MTEADLPFATYPGGGRTLLGPPRSGDGTARHAYGLQVHEWCEFRCAYCGLDLGTFEGWLQLSIDHVVPQQMVRAGYPREWVVDTVNIVACCMACNGMFNRDPAVGAVPANLDEFLAIRDALFLQRRARITERRRIERDWYEQHITPRVGARRAADARP
jgi:hypothetical protein